MSLKVHQELQLRDYQEETIQAIFDYYNQGNNGNVIAALPTGTGKSLVIAGFIYKVFQRWPLQRFIVLSHVEKILTQDYKAIKSMWPEAPVGLFSAGLNSRDIANSIIVGGVASVVNSIELFGFRDIVIVDEVHLVSPDEDTMYRKIIAGLTEINPNLKVIGTSATPYRLGQGLLTDGDLFDDIVIDLTKVDCFNRFIAEGYLSPLIPKRTNVEIDVSNVKLLKGDFATKQLDDATEKVIYEALKEAIQYGYNRNCWMVFCSGIKTSEHAAEILQSFGIPAAAIHSKLTKAECDKRFAAFECGELRAICGNEKFTTGYDFPPIDFCIMLRSTMSPGKWVQMLGRLTRPYDFTNPQQYIKGFEYIKQNALVMDFAGNTKRIGPINDPIIPRKKGEKVGDAPVKICEVCGVYQHASARWCGGKPFPTNEGCGAEFIFKTKITKTAGTDELIRGDLQDIQTINVSKVIYHKHVKIGSVPTIKVSYYCGLQRFTEYICLEHKGFARTRAVNWWRQRHNSEPPVTIDEALLITSQLRCPKSIKVRVDLKYPEIMGVEW